MAIGHIHAPQPVPGAPVPAAYAGSLLALDFGEAGEDKRVVVVDVEPGRLATLRSIPIHAGRPLEQVRGTWDEIDARADDLADRYLDLTVAVGGPIRSWSARRGTVPLPGAGARRAAGAAAAGAVAGGARRPMTSCTPLFVRATTGEDAPAELIAALPRHDGGGRRCVRVSCAIRGFRSYRDEATFDLRDRRLVGIVGPIGAGKSTILDAIAFALFGKTPRVQRETRSLINQLATPCHVSSSSRWTARPGE